jgi:hypothetical protein
MCGMNDPGHTYDKYMVLLAKSGMTAYHVQVSFTWNLSPLRPSKFSFEYLLLPPRFALTAAPPGLMPPVLQRLPCPPTQQGMSLAKMVGCGSCA